MTPKLALELIDVYTELSEARKWLATACFLLRLHREEHPETFELTSDDDIYERMVRTWEQHATPKDFDDIEWCKHVLGVLKDVHGDDDAIARRLEGLRLPSVRPGEFNRLASV